MVNFFIPQEADFRRWIREAIHEEFVAQKGQLAHDPVNESEPLLTRKKMAECLDISLVTLTDWVKKGLPHLRENGRMYFIKSEVVEYMRAKTKRFSRIESFKVKQ